MSHITTRRTAVLVALALAGCGGDDYRLGRVATLGLSTDEVAFGFAEQGSATRGTVTVTNEGDVALGIASIGLGSELPTPRGHEGAFALTWSCDDVVLPADTEARPVPEESALACILPPHASLPVAVDFTPARAGDNLDALRVLTAPLEDELNDPLARQDKVYADVTSELGMVYLSGESDRAVGRVVASPRTVDFGWVFEGQSVLRYLELENRGDAPVPTR